MDLPALHGIVPPLATPLGPDDAPDLAALEHLVEFQLGAGVHGLWVLGTTARFDLLPDGAWRPIAETAARVAAGRVPLVLNVSDMSTARTRERAARFDDLPYDAYAVLPPWYQPMTADEVSDYFLALADTLARPVVIYNAPWVCNMLSFEHLRRLAEHPRIVGVKDVSPSLTRTLDWTPADRRALNFSYLHGNDSVGLSTAMGADGFVISLSNPFPELCVATWDAVRAGDEARAYRLIVQLQRLGQIASFGTYLGCLEAAMRHRELLDRILPAPLRSLDAAAADKVAGVLDAAGVLPDPAPAGDAAGVQTARARG
jgi:4-hydroxy-tetrahydrodipicolinate synthase